MESFSKFLLKNVRRYENDALEQDQRRSTRTAAIEMNHSFYSTDIHLTQGQEAMVELLKNPQTFEVGTLFGGNGLPPAPQPRWSSNESKDDLEKRFVQRFHLLDPSRTRDGALFTELALQGRVVEKEFPKRTLAIPMVTLFLRLISTYILCELAIFSFRVTWKTFFL